MTSVFGLAQRYVHVILFVVLEIICLSLVVNYNRSQNQILANSASQITGSIKTQTSRINNLLDLEKENAMLSEQNAELIREIIQLTDRIKNQDAPVDFDFDYGITPAKIRSQDIHSLRNKLLINKGKVDSIRVDQGVISYDGVVGTISNVSKNYSSAISLLNIDLKISATLKGQDYFGTVSWSGQSYETLDLDGIPNHAEIAIGDSVMTNGYSTIFPPGIMVGIVKDWSLEKSGEFFNIKLTPSVSFSKINNVMIIDNLSFAEIKSLDE